MITHGKKQCASAATKTNVATNSGGRTRYRRSTLREFYTEMQQIESCRVDHHHIYAACGTALATSSDEFGTAGTNRG